MPAGFGDSPGKRMVREQLNTPLLRGVSNALGIQYFYCGLPGPDILDIVLWKDMIRRIVAFEIEASESEDPRRDLVALGRNLSLLGIPHKVHCGYLETTVLLGRDDDGEAYSQDELITLYNLDFCNAITGRVPTKEGNRCLRFEVLRHMLAVQGEQHRRSGQSKFILLLTVRDEFHAAEMQGFVSGLASGPVADFVAALPPPEDLPQTGMQRSTLHLKAFVFSVLRAYCHGHNISSLFLPPVKYVGRSTRSRMLHFAVLCRFGNVENALPVEVQDDDGFLRKACVHAQDDHFKVEPCSAQEPDSSAFELDGAIAFIHG